MGQVLLATHRLLERTVAVKLRLPARDPTEDQLLAERFRHGARLQAEMDHPHIARVYDYLESPGFQAIVMEYLPGGSLEEPLARRQGGLPVEDAVEMGIRCADALAYAHARGVVHRDIKPANLMLVDASDPRTVRITDYGVAKDPDRSPNLTVAGANVGTLWYMPPEQFNQDDPTPQADVYSLGATIYEMLTGELPFESEETGEIFRRFLDKVPPPPIRSRNPAVPSGIACVVEACLELDPAVRVPSSAALALLLRAAADVGGLGVEDAEVRRLLLAADPVVLDRYARSLADREVHVGLTRLRDHSEESSVMVGSTVSVGAGRSYERLPPPTDPLDDDDDRTMVMELPPLSEE